MTLSVKALSQNRRRTPAERRCATSATIYNSAGQPIGQKGAFKMWRRSPHRIHTHAKPVIQTHLSDKLTFEPQFTVLGQEINQELGDAVQISKDGSVVAVSSPTFDTAVLTDAGKVDVYKRAGTTWTLAHSLVGESANEFLGREIALSGDGNVLVASNPLFNGDAGIVRTLIISTGASDFWEVEKTLNFAKNINPKIILLQCTSIYPAKPITINLNVIKTFRKEFSETVIGYSGHDSGISIPIAAYSIGARVIEKHFTLDRSQKGTDHQFSLTPTLLKNLVDELENVRLSFGDGKKKLLSEEKLARFKMGKKIIASKKLTKGTVITMDDLLFKSPGDGVPPSELDMVLGKTITKDYSFEENIKLEDLN